MDNTSRLRLSSAAMAACSVAASTVLRISRPVAVSRAFGPDAGTLGTDTYYGNAGNFGVRQAYITLRAPVGNGIDFKVGVFDTIIGYESTSSPLNPNYTHSYGYSMEPTTHTGVLATYKFCDALSASAGIADSKGPVINDRPAFDGSSESFKTYMGAITLTAPQSWGWASGATLSGGVVSGNATGANDANTSWYVGTTIPTPCSALKFGASFDYLTAYEHNGWNGYGNPWALAFYANYQATEKLSFNGRAEWAKNYLDIYYPTAGLPNEQNAVALTGTIQYDLWANVLTRLEIRWDHASHDVYGGNVSGGGGYVENAILVALQAVYKF
jgi:hypothetical protein